MLTSTTSSGETTPSGEATVPLPVSVASCATAVSALGAATVSVLPEGVIVMFAPAASCTSPLNPFNLLTTSVGATPAVVCTVPSGNFKPPSVVSIIPCTVSNEVGVVVPIP